MRGGAGGCCGGRDDVAERGGGGAGVRGGVRSVDLSVGVYLTPLRYELPVVSHLLLFSQTLFFMIFRRRVWDCAWLVVLVSLLS